jgi:hypothetical protein
LGRERSPLNARDEDLCAAIDGNLNQSGLKPKLRGSTIPFRAIV